MLFKKIALIFAAAVLAVSACGCLKKEIVTTDNPDLAPDTTVRTDIEIEWNQLYEDVEEMLDSENFPYGKYFSILLTEADGKDVPELSWCVSDDCSQFDAMYYGEVLLKATNDAAIVQDYSIAPATAEYNGGLWDKYPVQLNVYWEKDEEDPSNFLIFQYMEAGSNAQVEPHFRAETSKTLDEELAEMGVDAEDVDIEAP